MDKKTLLIISVILILLIGLCGANLIYVYHGVPQSEGHPSKISKNRNGGDNFNSIDIEINKYYMITFLVIAFTAWIYISDKETKLRMGMALVAGVSLAIMIFYLKGYDFGVGGLQIVPEKSLELFKSLDFGRQVVEASKSTLSQWIFLMLLFFLIIAVLSERYNVLGSYSEVNEDKTIEEDFTDTIDKTILDLKKGKNVRTAIMNCYIKMCMMFESEGLIQESYLTPREFKSLAFKRLKTHEKPISELTGLFEEARYSEHEMISEDRERAIKDLRSIKRRFKRSDG